MAAHRYWRADQFTSAGGGALAINGLWLLDTTTRVAAAVVPTASVDPTTGALGGLSDTDAATGARWPAAAGLALTWDCTTPVSVTDIRVTAAVPWYEFVSSVRIGYSDDGTTWTTYTSFFDISWPGPLVATASVAGTLPNGTSGTYIARDAVRSGAVFDVVDVPGAEILDAATIFGEVSVAPLRTDFIPGLPTRGFWRIAGTVKDKAATPPNTPVFERVRLYEQVFGTFVADTMSHPVTGAYSFDFLPPGTAYFVISSDKDLVYRAAVADQLLPEFVP